MRPGPFCQNRQGLGVLVQGGGTGLLFRLDGGGTGLLFRLDGGGAGLLFGLNGGGAKKGLRGDGLLERAERPVNFGVVGVEVEALDRVGGLPLVELIIGGVIACNK